MSLSRSRGLLQVSLQQARALRRAMTPTERLLWQQLRKRQLGGWKFLRQRPILVELDDKETFIVADFYCAQAKLIVEVDGSSHTGQEAADALRDRAAECRGYAVVRIAASTVEHRMSAVLALLQAELEHRAGTTNPPLPLL